MNVLIAILSHRVEHKIVESAQQHDGNKHDERRKQREAVVVSSAYMFAFLFVCLGQPAISVSSSDGSRVMTVLHALASLWVIGCYAATRE